MEVKKKNIAYISIDYFADVDLPILPCIAKEFNVTWFLFISNPNRYDFDEIKTHAKNNNFDLELFFIGNKSLTFSNLIKFIGFAYKLYKYKFNVYYFEFYMALFMLIIIQFISKNKKILALHDVKPHSNHYKKRQHIFQSLLIKSFSYFHTFSKQQQHILKDSYAKDSFFIPLSKKNSGKSNVVRSSVDKHLKFLFFGGIYSYKRLDLIIKAIQQVPSKTDKKLSLTIAGNGPDWENCKKYIKNETLFNLDICFVPQNAIPDLFMSHHYLVLPYQDVTQSGPLFDAMNYNLPVIASDEKGFKEYVKNGKTGFIFESQSLESLTSVIEEVCKIDQNLYQEILYNLNSYSDIYTAQNVAKLYISMFSDFHAFNHLDVL